MADGIVQLQPDSTGKKVDTSELTVGANVVERQRVVVASDTGATAIASVTAANGLAVDVTRVQGVVAAAQSGGWTVQPGNTANTTAWLVNGPALAKATQGANGFTTQDLKDAGRASKAIFLDAFTVAATAETLKTVSVSTDCGAPATGSNYAVTSGKRFRLQQITASLHTIAGNTTAVNVIVRIRVNAAGAAVATSPIQFVFALQGVAGANQAGAIFDLVIPDGFEIPAGAGVGVTTACAGFVATTAAPKVNLTLTGYEY